MNTLTLTRTVSRGALVVALLSGMGATNVYAVAVTQHDCYTDYYTMSLQNTCIIENCGQDSWITSKCLPNISTSGSECHANLTCVVSKPPNYNSTSYTTSVSWAYGQQTLSMNSQYQIVTNSK